MFHFNPENRLGRFLACYYPSILVLLVVIAVILADRTFRNQSQNPYDSGMANFASQKYDAAIADFHQALWRNPSDIASLFQLGFAYHLKGWPDEALKEYEDSGPRAFAMAYVSYHNSGCIYQTKGQSDLAEAAYLKALRANPNAIDSLANLLLIYESRKEYDKALRACRTYLEANPKDATFLLRAGQIAEKLKQNGLARQFYRDALAANANSPAKDRLRALTEK